MNRKPSMPGEIQRLMGFRIEAALQISLRHMLSMKILLPEAHLLKLNYFTCHIKFSPLANSRLNCAIKA